VKTASGSEQDNDYVIQNDDVYDYIRTKDDKTPDNDILSEAEQAVEEYFISFFTDTTAYVKAREVYNKTYQTRLDKNEWSSKINELKNELQPAINREWKQKVGGISKDITGADNQINITKLRNGEYKYFVTLYSNDTEYKAKLRMTFLFSLTIKEEVILPKQIIYTYWGLLSEIIKQLGDTFPFRNSRDVIKELISEGVVERFIDEKGHIRYRSV